MSGNLKSARNLPSKIQFCVEKDKSHLTFIDQGGAYKRINANKLQLYIFTPKWDPFTILQLLNAYFVRLEVVKLID